MIQIIVISVILLALALAGLAIKILSSKDGEFKKSCGSVDPITGKNIGCTCGKSDGGESCENKDDGIRYQTVRIED
jgi:hypothetical protein